MRVNRTRCKRTRQNGLFTVYGIGTNQWLTWWVAEFRNGERLQVCTESELKYEAWQEVSRMFLGWPGRELVSICTEQEELICRRRW